MLTVEQIQFSEHLRSLYGDDVAFNYLKLVTSEDYANKVGEVREFRFRKTGKHLRSD